MSSVAELCYDMAKPYAMVAAGALFGAGWWTWGDAVTVSVAVRGHDWAPVLIIPGLVATLAIIIMNFTSRADLNDSAYSDDASLCRSKLTLFISYVFAIASIGAAVAILLIMKKNQDEELWLGAAGIMQSSLVIASGLVAWGFREGSNDDGYGYIG